LLIIATATLGLSAPTAQADTHYGGVAALRNAPAGPSLSLVRHDDGRITARVAFAYTCRRHSFYNYVVKLHGSTPDGVNFAAAGKQRLRGVGTMRLSMRGTLAADSAAGKLTWGVPGCRKFTRDLMLRTASAPAGAPAAPAAASLFAGLTGQTAAGVPLAIALRVTKKGRVWGIWGASMQCGPKATSQIVNASPTTKIRPDGSFARNETFTIRWNDGSRERYLVNLTGRFLADGAAGTMRVRSQLRKRGHRYYPCDSGTVAWAART
jgi:hypothetical protein